MKCKCLFPLFFCMFFGGLLTHTGYADSFSTIFLPLVLNVSVDTLTPNPTATTAAIETTIQNAINATLTAMAPTATPTPNLTATAMASIIETAVSATVTAVAPTATVKPTESATLTPEATIQPVLYDNFDDNSANSSMWTPIIYGSASTIAELNQRLEIVHSADGSDAPNRSFFGAHYVNNCQLAGNFDVHVDYNLLNWPIANGVRLGLSIDDDTDMSYTFHVERLDTGLVGQQNGYVTDFGGVNTFVPTQDLTGKLRLTRNDDKLTGYYFQSGNWISLYTIHIAIPSLYVSLNSWSNGYTYGGREVKVAFDNFTVVSGEVVCPSLPTPTPTPTATFIPTAPPTNTH